MCFGSPNVALHQEVENLRAGLSSFFMLAIMRERSGFSTRLL
jgi:hypothetical protein